jgi:group II intron reverse transcriptase/maturase
MDHELLIKLVKRRVRDPRLLRLIRRWLRVGVMHEGILEETLVGSPQGAVISPLLSNIYLHPLDLYWEREVKATKMVRHADDLVVLCRWKPPETYMPKLKQFLTRLRVTINEDKTRIAAARDGFDFLGVHFRKQPTRRDPQRSFCYCWPSRRSMQRIRDKVQAILDRNTRPALEEKLGQLNPVLRGWSAYFRWLNSAQHFRKVDQYVTFKLRRWLQAKHQRRRRAFWKTPLAYWRKAGLYSIQGRIAHTS